MHWKTKNRKKQKIDLNKSPRTVSNKKKTNIWKEKCEPNDRNFVILVRCYACIIIVRLGTNMFK